MISSFEQKYNEMNSSLASLEGKLSLSKEQLKENTEKVDKLNANKELYEKCAEFLSFVEKTSQEFIKESFESVVTHAMQYLYGEECSFQLEFGKRGKLGELKFNIITKDLKSPADPLDTEAGGILDIVSLALRLVLLEISNPRVEGAIILDETFKHLDSNKLENASNFLDFINKKFKRQIIFITHHEKFIEDPSYNKIEVK